MLLNIRSLSMPCCQEVDLRFLAMVVLYTYIYFTHTNIYLTPVMIQKCNGNG